MFIRTLLMLSLVATPIWACINTSYSRDDEVVITDDLGHLIIGAFAHHGKAFYEAEVKRCLAILKKNPKDFEARNDLGAAYTKLSEWEKAQAAFDDNERRYPGRYKTASNLGVLYKKMGEYGKAKTWIEKALAIKPGGHMGLGDYYLRMIEWRAVDEKARLEKKRATTNFLGVPYSSGPQATAVSANKQYVITLIKNDMAFSDAYIVLGDILYTEKNYQMALRAYHRASEFDEDWRVVNDRVENVMKQWRQQRRAGFVVERGQGHSQIRSEFRQASDWLAAYQRLEAARIELGEDVSFAAMKKEMAKRQILKPRMLEAVHYRGREVGPGRTRSNLSSIGFWFQRYWYVTAIGLVIGLIVLARINRHRHQGPHPGKPAMP